VGSGFRNSEEFTAESAEDAEKKNGRSKSMQAIAISRFGSEDLHCDRLESANARKE
jgi:hypothetical protein